VLLHDADTDPKEAFEVKVHLAVPGPDIHAEDRESTLYAAIDKVTDKLAGQLRKRKTKMVEHDLHIAKLAAEKAKRG